MFNPFYRTNGKNNNNIVLAGAMPGERTLLISILMLRLLPLGTQFIVLSDSNRYDPYFFIFELLGPDLSEGASLEEGFSIIAEPPTLSKLVQALIEHAGRESESAKAEVLRDLARGALFTVPSVYSSIIAGTANIERATSKPLILFNIDIETSPRHESAITFALSEYILDQAEAAKLRRRQLAVIIDQSSSLMRSEAGIAMLDQLSRHSRNTGMMLLVGTDRIQNLSSSSGSNSLVLKNADTKIVLRQQTSDLQILKESLHLSDLTTLAVENFSLDCTERRYLMISSHTTGIVKLDPSPLEDWICTSYMSDKIAKRTQAICDKRVKTPNLSVTDACRRAVYELASLD